MSRFTRHIPAAFALSFVALGVACSSGQDTAPIGGASDADGGKHVGPTDAGGGALSDATPATGDDASTPPSGETGDAGDAAAEAAAPTLLKSWTFDTTVDPWDVDYADPASLKGINGTVVSLDSKEGMPTAGSLKAEIPFTAASQKVEIAVNLEAPVDLTGKTVTARFKLDSGLTSNPSSPGGVKLYVKSGAGFLYADSGWNNLNPADGWFEITLTADKPGGYVATSDAGAYSAADIRQIGLEIATGSAGTGWEPAVVHIDTVGWY